jgi:hypothetical protein
VHVIAILDIAAWNDATLEDAEDKSWVPWHKHEA